MSCKYEEILNNLNNVSYEEATEDKVSSDAFCLLQSVVVLYVADYLAVLDLLRLITIIKRQLVTQNENERITPGYTRHTIILATFLSQYKLWCMNFFPIIFFFVTEVYYTIVNLCFDS